MGVLCVRGMRCERPAVYAQDGIPRAVRLSGPRRHGDIQGKQGRADAGVSREAAEQRQMTDTTDRETHHELVDVLLEIRDRSPEAYNSVKRAIRQWGEAVDEVDSLGDRDEQSN